MKLIGRRLQSLAEPCLGPGFPASRTGAGKLTAFYRAELLHKLSVISAVITDHLGGWALAHTVHNSDAINNYPFIV